MLSNKKIEEKIREMKEKNVALIEWTEEIPRTNNPLSDGVLEGNFIPDHKFMLKEASMKCYKLYKYNEEAKVYENIMVWNA